MRRWVAAVVLMVFVVVAGMALAQRAPFTHQYSRTKVRNHNVAGLPIQYDTLAIGGSGTQLVLENLTWHGMDSVNALGLRIFFITKAGALPFLTFNDSLTANQFKYGQYVGPIAFPRDSMFLMGTYTRGPAGTVVDSFRCVATFTAYPSR